MTQITIIEAGGQAHAVEAQPGLSLLRAALAANLHGVIGECGGAAMCATCHVYVDDAWLHRLPAPGDEENDMLDFVSSPRRPNSRLGCQIAVQADWDGLTVRLPETQA